MSTHRHHPPTALVIVAALTTTTTTTACTIPTAQAAAPISITRPGELTATARTQLAALPVRVEDTGAQYNRDEWGDWTTTRGCTTREAVLRRDGHDVTTGADCRITSGRWVSTYDDVVITAPGAVQIDHRVPVKEANRSGARTWTRDQQARFYNDTTNLVAVSGRSNTSKGDRDPGTWRPPARESWCGYATAYVATKTTYRLTVDDRERAGLVAMLNTCGGAR